MSDNQAPEIPPVILSVQQPTGWLVAQDLRASVMLSVSASYRGPVLLHVGTAVENKLISGFKLKGLSMPRPLDMPTLAVLGLAQLVDCQPAPDGTFRVILEDVIPCAPFKWEKAPPGLSLLSPRQRELLEQRFARGLVQLQREKRVRDRLGELNLTYGHLCKITNLKENAIARALRDQSIPVSQETMAQIAFALAVSPEWVSTGQGDKEDVGNVELARSTSERIGRLFYRRALKNKTIAMAISEPEIAVRRLTHFIFSSDSERLEKLCTFLLIPKEQLTTQTNVVPDPLFSNHQKEQLPPLIAQNAAAQRIQDRCRAHGYTLRNLQLIAGLSTDLALRCLSDFSGPECEDVIDRLAKGLDVTPEWLLTGEGDIRAVDPNWRIIAKRLSDCMNRTKFSDHEFARVLGERIATVRRLKLRVFESDEKHLQVLTSLLGVNIDWLKTGVDPTTERTVSVNSMVAKAKKRPDLWSRFAAISKAEKFILHNAAGSLKEDQAQKLTGVQDTNIFKGTREALGLKLKDIASHLGVSSLTIMDWEDNPGAAPSELLERWQAFLAARTRATAA